MRITSRNLLSFIVVLLCVLCMTWNEVGACFCSKQPLATIAGNSQIIVYGRVVKRIELENEVIYKVKPELRCKTASRGANDFDYFYFKSYRDSCGVEYNIGEAHTFYSYSGFMPNTGSISMCNQMSGDVGVWDLLPHCNLKCPSVLTPKEILERLSNVDDEKKPDIRPLPVGRPILIDKDTGYGNGEGRNNGEVHYGKVEGDVNAEGNMRFGGADEEARDSFMKDAAIGMAPHEVEGKMAVHTSLFAPPIYNHPMPGPITTSVSGNVMAQLEKSANNVDLNAYHPQHEDPVMKKLCLMQALSKAVIKKEKPDRPIEIFPLPPHEIPPELVDPMPVEPFPMPMPRPMPRPEGPRIVEDFEPQILIAEPHVRPSNDPAVSYMVENDMVMKPAVMPHDAKPMTKEVKKEAKKEAQPNMTFSTNANVDANHGVRSLSIENLKAQIAARIQSRKDASIGSMVQM